MKEECFVDTTVILKVILEKQIDVLKKLSRYTLYTSVNVLEESAFKNCSCVLEALEVERANIYKIKEELGCMLN